MADMIHLQGTEALTVKQAEALLKACSIALGLSEGGFSVQGEILEGKEANSARQAWSKLELAIRFQKE